MRLASSLLLGLVLGLPLGILGSAATARAHPLSFGVLRVRELGGGAARIRLRFSGTEARPTGARLILPEGCPLEAPTERRELAVGGEEIEARIACGGAGLGGRELGVEGLEGSGVAIQVWIEGEGRPPYRGLLDDGQRRLRVPRAQAPPRSAEVLLRHLALGLEHIALGVDHLLFVLGLLLLVRSRRRLLVTVTAFTVGHSLTLALSALSLIRLPIAPVEAAIALSILLLAVELSRPREASSLTRRHPEWVAGAFGLLHGLGFASALLSLGLPREGMGLALLGFNLGVEVGQLLFLALCLLLWQLLRRLPRRGTLGRLGLYGYGGAAAYFLFDRLAGLGG